MQRKNTKQRGLVLSAVRAHRDHPSADEIYLDVREKDPKISRGTVYRNLSVLAESGDITHVKVPAAERFDFRLDKHYHLICTGCGAVIDADIPYCDDYDRRVEEQSGFKVELHRTIFEGLCPECRKHAEQDK